jgi:hypothetical protein
VTRLGKLALAQEDTDSSLTQMPTFWSTGKQIIFLDIRHVVLYSIASCSTGAHDLLRNRITLLLAQQDLLTQAY